MSSNSAAPQIAARLRDAEQRLGGILAMTTEAIICADDEDRRIVVFNRGAERIFGYSPEEIIGEPLETLVPEWVRDAHPGYVSAFVASGEGSRLMSDRLPMIGCRKNGELFEAHISISAVRDDDGGIVTAVVHDVSELRAAERELRRSEADLHGLVERSTFGIYRSAADGRLLMVNPALIAMLGYKSEVELMSVGNIVELYADPGERTRLVKRLGGMETVRGVEVVWKKRDGAPITVLLTGRPIRDKSLDLVAFEFFVEDVTERVALERKVQQSQRIESVGRLAGGVAHDFNNLLSVIIGFTELALTDIKASPSMRSNLGEALRAAERAADLTRQLLAFSRQHVVAPSVFSVDALLTDMETLVRKLVRDDISMVLHRNTGAKQVRIDRGQLEQVLMNLAVNANDAMQEGGVLTIETSTTTVTAASSANFGGLPPGEYVALSVRDTGTGMSEEITARIFEPFFTTKEVGKGTGLGLATSYGIVQQAGGELLVASRIGEGTTMTVVLPVVEGERELE